MGLFSRIFSRKATGRNGGSPPIKHSVADSPQARNGIIARLRQMYRREEPMSQIQLDLCAIESFSLFRYEGLHEFLASEGWFLTVLPDAMRRHGLVRLASALEDVLSFVPAEALAAPRLEISQHLVQLYHTHREEMIELDEAIERIDEDHEAVVEGIFREHWAELPEPLEMVPGYHGTNPFTGEPTYFKPRYPT